MAVEYSNIIGKQEDWAAVVTDVEMIDTPVLAWLPVGDKPVQAERLYQVDAYAEAAENSHPDGVPVTGAKSAGRNRKQLRSVIQYSTKAADVTKLNQDYGNVAGVSDELMREIGRQTKELSKDIESACLSGQECRVGTSALGYKTRGIPNWVSSSAQSVYPVDSDVRTPSGSIVTTAITTTLTEDVLLNILQSMADQKRASAPVMGFCGPTVKRIINNMPQFLSSSASTTNSGAYPRNMRGANFDRVIQSYNSDFGEVSFGIAWNLGALDSEAAYATHGILLLHQDNWEIAWGEGGKPQWVKKPYEGGHHEAFCESVWMLTCWDPRPEGKYWPTTP